MVTDVHIGERGAASSASSRTRHAVDLSAAGLSLREVEPCPPVTAGYRLTPDGTALMSVLGESAGWASRHRPETPTASQRVGRV
ncbi:hypothetical protein [Streptomyces sp. NPDC052015]|uniref:hypothetical protein n=1 Tax=Streptomyces sp. NPDC052015 TaxID=3154755 RepID=UPI00344AAA88